MTEQNDFESELAELAALEVAMYDPLDAAAELSETVKEKEEDAPPEVAELDATPDAPPASEPPPPVSGIAMVGGQVARASVTPSITSEPGPTGRDQASFDPPVDNVEAAMDHLAETMDFNVSRKVSEDEGPADKQILIRSTQRDHERWKLAAEREGESLSAFVRRIVNGSVTEILDCSHPAESRQTYPWSETCLKCGLRLRDGGDNSPNSAAGRRG